MTTTVLAPSTFNAFVMPTYADVRPEIFVRRDHIASALLGAEADTLGWDSVNAILLPEVNAAMVASGRSPKAFERRIQDNWTISGTFDSWRLVRGGSGAIVFLRAPLTTAHMSFTGSPDLDFTDGWVTVAIKLQYLPQPPGEGHPDEPDDSDGIKQYLASDPSARSADDPAVVVQAVDYGSAKPDDMQRALFAGAIANWFNANLATFTYVFSVVNLNSRAAKEQFQWLKPTYSSYAYFNGATDATSYFGVLNMTSGAQPDGLTNQLPPSAIPADCNASILVSNELFMRQMILPGLTKSFVNATESSFRITGKGKVIENLVDITLDDIKVDASSYTPILTSFTLQVVGDEIQIDTQTRVNISPGINVFIRATEYYRLKLVDKPDGGQTLDFEKARAAKREHWVKTDLWVDITVGIVALAGAVATTVAGKLINELVKRIIAVVIIGLIAGLIAAIPKIIALVMDGKAAEALPAIGDLVMEASSDVRWPDSSGITLLSAGLNGSLQLGGKLQPPAANR